MSANYRGYILTLGEVLTQFAKEAKHEKDAAIGTEEEDYKTGYLMCFHRVITLMQQQATMFDVPQEEILSDIFSESDLL